jgi:hypothetical protein
MVRALLDGPPMRSSAKPALAAVVAVTLAGCNPTLSSSLSGVDPELLVICRMEDPIKNAVDDERSLCLTFSLDAARVQASSPGTRLKVAGTAQFEDRGASSAFTFTPEAGSSETIESVTALGSCFTREESGALSQHLTGQLTLERITGSSLAGWVEVTVTGGLAFADCGWGSPAEVKGTFATDGPGFETNQAH